MQPSDHPTVLLVDDEPAILSGIRRAARRQVDWHLLTAASGREAVEVLTSTHVDVLVTDMRMPGYSGMDVLSAGRELQPWMVRMVLSGQADRTAAVAALPFVHRLLSKPCAWTSLRDAIARSLQLSHVVPDLAERRRAGLLTRLPSALRQEAALDGVLQAPDCQVADLAAIISQDVGLTVRTLQIANSAFFGMREAISSVHAAVSYLGAGLIREAFTRDRMDAPLQVVADQPGLVALNERAVAAASTCREAAGSDLADDAWLVAMLTEIGAVVRLGVDPGARVEDIDPPTALPAAVALLHAWGLPQPVVQAVATATRPQPETRPEADDLLSPTPGINGNLLS